MLYAYVEGVARIRYCDGAVPFVLLRTYYMQAKFTADKDKYLILLDDVCVCAFKTDKGVRVDFGSYFNGTANKTITGGQRESTQTQSG